MRHHPLVSVIIPTYNRADLLKETLDSVLAQTYTPIECIVVDDGSPDETPRLLADYAGHYPGRIVPIRQGNRGGTAARNTGALAARGDLLNFLDHDDLFLPEKIERQVRLLQAHPELGLAHCGYYRMDARGGYIERISDLPQGDVRVRLVQGCFLWSGAPLIRRECLERVGLFDESVWSSDADMWLRIARAGYPFGCVQEPLGCYRLLPDSSMADVERTERMDMAILERAFADSRLPPEARKMRDQAYFNQRFWLGFRYYTVGRGEDGRRNLAEALRRKPQLLKKPPELLQSIVGHLLDPRVPDPPRLAQYVFEHLPRDVERVVAPYRRYLSGWVWAGLALRNYGRGRVEQAREQLAWAVALEPGITERVEEFIRAAEGFALKAVLPPLTCAELVLNNLPPAGRSLARVRQVLLARLSAEMARRHFRNGRRHAAPALVLNAMRHDHSLLKSPRMLGLLMLSLPSWYSGKLRSALRK